MNMLKNRKLITGSSIVSIVFLVFTLTGTALAGGTVDTSASPHARLRSVDLDDVRWTKGFWAKKFQLTREQIVPAIRKAMMNPENSAYLDNFRIAAGLKEGKHRGVNWSDGDVYKWLETLAHLYAVTGEKKLDRELDKWIRIIGKAQREDGFISTNAQIDEMKNQVGSHGDVKPLDIPHTHQLYNMGHLITAGVIHHRATGKKTFLRIAKKTANFLDRTFRPTPEELIHFPWNPSVYMGLMELYRTTDNERYLKLAQTLIGNRGADPGDPGGDTKHGGTDQIQDRVPIRKEDQAVGHAVTATYLYSGTADLYAETGEDALLKALQRIRQDVVNHHMYITGAIGAGGGSSPRGDSVHEAFSGDYDMPLKNSYAETCANIGNAMWHYRMLLLTGKATYADTLERVLYNSMLSGVNISGDGFFYCNPHQWNAEEGHGHHRGKRWTTDINSYCCPPNVSRTLAKLQNWAYSVTKSGVWVHLYGSSRLDTELPDGSHVRMTQKTDYPWDGRVQFRINQAPDRPVGVRLRIPGWASDASVTVNGEAVDQSVEPGTYFTIRRLWSADDRVTLRLPMNVQLMEAHPKLRNRRNKVAVKRGPIVYAVEEPVKQNGDEKWKRGIFFPENIQLTPEHRSDLFQGVTVLKGRALTKDGRDQYVKNVVSDAGPVPSSSNGADDLFSTFDPRDLPQPEQGTQPVTLIPYYAWANRGLSYMQVWTPLAR